MHRIAIFTNSIFSIGGEQRVVSVIANELSKKYDVTIFTMDGSSHNQSFVVSDKVHIEYFHPYTKDFVSFVCRAMTHMTPILVYRIYKRILERAYCPDKYAKLMSNCLDKGYDTVIATSWQLSIILGKVKRSYSPNIYAIAWEHSSYEAYFEQKYFYLYNNKELFSNNLKYIDKIVVLNDDYRKKYIEKLGLSSVVIYNPKSFKSSIKSELKNKTILACSRIDYEHKGIDLLIEAFSIFCKEDEEWTLIVAGDGPALKKYQSIIRKKKLDNRIKCIGNISDVKGTMLKASVFVLPSRFEGFPMSVTEAFEVGLPVLAFDIPAMQPFKDSGGAVTVPCFETLEFANALRELTCNYEKRREMGLKAVEFANSIDISYITKKWDSIIDNRERL